MKLEQQVVSLDLAKRLKELGVKQESLFDWVGNIVLPSGRIDFHIEYGNHNYDIHYPAYTVAELGEMLPGNDGEYYFMTQRGLMGNQWYCTRCRLIDMKDQHQEITDTEADARAKMLIYLLENNLITPAIQDKE